MSRSSSSPPTNGWSNRIVGYEADVDPEQLLANPLNWREHPGMQRDALRGSLESVGWVDTVMVNNTTGHVVDGHARIEEAISKGSRVPVLYVELTEDEERLVLATFDPIGAMAERSDERLRELLATISTNDSGLSALLDTLRGTDPFDTLNLTGDPDSAPELGFEVTVTVSRAQDRDTLVAALREQGYAPNVRSVRA